METKEALEKSMKERMVFGNGQEYLKSHALMDNGEYRELVKAEAKPVEEKAPETKSVKETVNDLLKGKRVWVPPTAGKKGYYRMDPRTKKGEAAGGEKPKGEGKTYGGGEHKGWTREAYAKLTEEDDALQEKATKRLQMEYTGKPGDKEERHKVLMDAEESKKKQKAAWSEIRAHGFAGEKPKGETAKSIVDEALDLLKGCGSAKDKAKWEKAKKAAKKGYPEKKQKARWPIVQKVYQQMKGKGKKAAKSLKEMVSDLEKGVR